MGIDHGLGGRDGLKSKQKREKKAKKNKVIAMRALTGGKKKEVIFDENARTEWLSGFHKRKQERRKYGLAMEVLKKQKSHKELLRDQRNVFKEENAKKNKGTTKVEDSEEEEEDAEDPEIEQAIKYTNSLAPTKNQEVSVFEDPSTVSMFGSTVSVVVDTSIGDAEESGADSENEADNRSVQSSYSMKSTKSQKKEPSRLEKALKKAKIQMSTKKKKHKDNSVQGKASSKALKSKVEGSKLLSKVLRKPMNGKHSGGRRRK